jgi:hypothetical protein
MCQSHTAVKIALAVAIFFWGTSAHAHPGYPSVAQQTLGLPSVPPCSICHVDPAGGGPLASFGSLLVNSYGLSASLYESDASLRAALQALESGPDANLVTVLRQGEDPNNPRAPASDDSGTPVMASPPPFTDPVPQYGCSCHTAGTTNAPTGLVDWAALTVLATITQRRARRRIAGSPPLPMSRAVGPRR